MVYGFLGHGLLLQGHSSKGLMAEAGVSLEVRGSSSRMGQDLARSWLASQLFHQIYQSGPAFVSQFF